MNETLLEKINTDKTIEYLPAILFAAFVILFGVLGNLMAFVFYGWKVPKNSTNFLITALSAIDLFTCIILCGEVIELCHVVNFKNVPGCKIMYFLNQWLVMTSGSMLLLIASDRFRKICRPLKWQFTKRGSKLAVSFVVSLMLIISVRNFVVIDIVEITKEMKDYGNDNVTLHYCTMSNDPKLHDTIQVFHFVDLLAFLIIIGGSIVLYGMIIWAIVQSRSRMQEFYNQSLSASESALCNREKDRVWATRKSSSVSFSKDTSVDLDKTTNSIESASVKEIPIARKNSALSLGQSSISCARKSAQKQMKMYLVEKKITIMMIIVTVVSLTSFVPHFVINLAIKAKVISEEDELKLTFQFLIRLFMLNNAVNPYIMAICNHDFRKFIKNTLCGRIQRFYTKD